MIYDLAKYGFKTEIIDLRDTDGEALRQALAVHDILWLAGGNTFMLRAELHRSGLDSLIPDLLKDGKVYCGESAGAIIAGTTLEGSEDADDPELADEKIVDGLGLVDAVIVPHADNPEYVPYVSHMKKRYAKNPHVIYLNDDQAFVLK